MCDNGTDTLSLYTSADMVLTRDWTTQQPKRKSVLQSNALKILLIDDDIPLAESLQMYFEQFGHELLHADRPSKGIKALETQLPDAVLLDIMMPEQDGLSLCRDIRSHNTTFSNVPIIMLTARGDVTDRIVGLEVGADDYLPKPFEPRELLARISSVLRRYHVKDTIGTIRRSTAPQTGVQINADTRQVWLDGSPLELSTMELELLIIFADSPGKKWSRDELTSRLRGTNAELYSRAVDTLVSRLRQRLGDTSKQSRFIQTIWGYGYCFLAQSTELDDADH